MKILGIDYGRSKIGLALSEGSLAEPYKVIRYKDIGVLEEQIKEILDTEKIDKIVVGISEGEMGNESQKFAEELGRSLKIPTEEFDETLSSKDAQRLSIEAGIGRKRRHLMEDAYAAAIMLQNFLDTSYLGG